MLLFYFVLNAHKSLYVEKGMYFESFCRLKNYNNENQTFQVRQFLANLTAKMIKLFFYKFVFENMNK